MSFKNSEIDVKSLSNAYIFEGKNEEENKAFALDFAREVFSYYGIDDINNPDLYLIDKEAAVIDIETIRQVLKDIYLRPYNGRIKIYIIHNAQNLRQEGSNAMLKSLEELKDYVKIIFTCTNRYNLLATIRSRCQIIPIKTEENELDIDMDRVFGIISDIYNGKIETYYKNKEFFAKYKDDRQTIYKALLKVYQDLISYNYNKDGLDYNTKYILKKFPQVSVDEIEKAIFLIEDIQNAARTNINYDLSIEKIIFNIFREGNF